MNGKTKRTGRRWALSCLSAVMILATACTAAPKGELGANGAVKRLSAPVYPEKQELPREYDDAVRELLSAYSGFAAQSATTLLGGGQENVAYSPVSLYMALALSASGAAGETQEEMYAAMGLSGKTEQQIAEAVRKLYSEWYGEEEYGHLFLNNSLWLSSENQFEQDFLNNAERSYFAEVFSINPAETLKNDPIAEWIAEKTGGKLERIPIDQVKIVMSIVSVIDFYGEWTDQFNKSRNTTGDFTLANGEKITAEYMNRTSFGGFSRGASWTQASLSCKNQAQMTFILPDAGMDINALLADEATVAAMLSQGESPAIEGRYGEINWSVPKFDIQSELALVELLKGMGIRSAFAEDADFSPTSATKPLFIASAQQAARVAIDENGVSAAAYTELAYAGAGMPEDKAEMILDRPFGFVITHQGAVLFVGVVNNPS